MEHALIKKVCISILEKRPTIDLPSFVDDLETIILKRPARSNDFIDYIDIISPLFLYVDMYFNTLGSSLLSSLDNSVLIDNSSCNRSIVLATTLFIEHSLKLSKKINLLNSKDYPLKKEPTNHIKTELIMWWNRVIPSSYTQRISDCFNFKDVDLVYIKWFTISFNHYCNLNMCRLFLENNSPNVDLQTEVTTSNIDQEESNEGILNYYACILEFLDELSKLKTLAVRLNSMFNYKLMENLLEQIDQNNKIDN